MGNDKGSEKVKRGNDRKQEEKKEGEISENRQEHKMQRATSHRHPKSQQLWIRKGRNTTGLKRK